MRGQPDLPKTRRLNVETAVVVGLGLGRYREPASADETAEPSFGSLVLRETGTGREDAKRDCRSSVYLGGLRIKCAPPIFDILQSKEASHERKHLRYSFDRSSCWGIVYGGESSETPGKDSSIDEGAVAGA